jgi:hypothetical protein
MISEIIKEKTSADHLLYVSLKYTKTCDVILNLLARWKSMIEMSFDAILDNGVKSGKVPAMPATPKQRIEDMKKYFVSNPAIQEIIPLYIFFKRVPELSKSREGEFRKNICLKIKLPNKEVHINMEKLDEYSVVVENFMNEVKKILVE